MMEQQNQGIDLTEAIKKQFDNGAIKVQIYLGSRLHMTIDKDEFAALAARDESEA